MTASAASFVFKWRAAVRINSAYQRSVYRADTASEGPTQDSQTKLKRARLADNLNEKIALRPGPLELVEKNIIPVDSTVKEAIKGNEVQQLPQKTFCSRVTQQTPECEQVMFSEIPSNLPNLCLNKHSLI